MVQRLVREVTPHLVVVDPITSFAQGGTEGEVQQMLTRLVDCLKAHEITGVFTSLTGGGSAVEQSEVAISSIIDAWLLVQDRQQNAERNRTLYIVKARGLAHSNQVREFVLTKQGIVLVDAYLGPGEVLTGSARLAQEARDRAAALVRRQEREQLQAQRTALQQAFDAQVAQLRAEYGARLKALDQELAREALREQGWENGATAQRESREADLVGGQP
jgi:circadian clock protein KaiC